MNNENIDTASRELWENAKSIYIMSLRNTEEKNQAERNLGMMITSVANEGNVFKIFTSTQFAADLISRDYISKLKGSFMVAGAPPDIQLEVKCDTTSKPTLILPKAIHPAPMPLQSDTPVSTFVSTLPLNEDYTFEEFVRGPSNSFALSAAEGVVNNPGKTGFNPLFIHGGTGLGKTHLMQSIGNELRKRNPSMAICYLTAETFLNEYVTSLQTGQTGQDTFRKKYRSVDMLLIDDVQFLQKGKAVQEEFFNTFNALRDNHKQIVMTSDVAPKNLPSIEERLISRFEGGMVQEVESPSYETRLAILKKKSESFNMTIPAVALEFIADNIKSHVRAMEGALGKVTIYIKNYPQTELNNSILSMLLKDFIEKEQSLRKLTVEEIQQACAKKFCVTLADILSHERTQSIVTPRQMAMYITRKYTSKGLQEIADAFGKKHATIINGVKTISHRLENEANLKVELEEILATFGYRLSDAMD